MKCAFTLYKKGVALCLSVIFLISGQTLPAHAQSLSPLSNSHLEILNPQNLAQVSIPSEWGEVSDFQSGKGQPVILIQDAHAIPDAQKNIHALIRFFEKKYGVQNVAVEGAASPLDAQIFRSFPDQKLLKNIFKEYYARAELSGAAAASVFTKPSVQFRGIEDRTLYENAIQDYLNALEKEPELLEKLSAEHLTLNAEKEKIYSKELLEVDHVWENFSENQSDFLKTLKVLKKFKAPAPDSALAAIAGSMDREQGANDALNLEIKSAVKVINENLGQNEKLNRALIMELNQKQQAYQTGETGQQEFAAWIQKTARARNLKIKLSKELLNLSKLQLRLEAIRGTKLLKEFEAYAKLIKQELLRQQPEDARQQIYALEEESEELRLLKRLANLELSREDWIKVSGTKVSDTYAAHIAFYKNAEKREEAFFTNLQQTQTRSRISPVRDPGSLQGEPVIFVAGGFHTEGMTEKLKKAGISYLVITPKITSLPEKNKYREHMSGNVSWKSYFKIENGRIRPYDAFVRAVRDQLLAFSGQRSAISSGLTLNAERLTLLKNWRDQIIRDLADQGKAQNAWKYTKFLDEILSNHEPRFTSHEGMAERLSRRVDQFVSGLRSLNSSGKLNQTSIAGLLNSMTAVEWSAGAGQLSSDLSIPANIVFKSKTAILKPSMSGANKRSAARGKSPAFSGEPSEIKRSEMRMDGKINRMGPEEENIFSDYVRVMVEDPEMFTGALRRELLRGLNRFIETYNYLGSDDEFFIGSVFELLGFLEKNAPEDFEVYANKLILGDDGLLSGITSRMLNFNVRFHFVYWMLQSPGAIKIVKRIENDGPQVLYDYARESIKKAAYALRFGKTYTVADRRNAMELLNAGVKASPSDWPGAQDFSNDKFFKLTSHNPYEEAIRNSEGSGFDHDLVVEFLKEILKQLPLQKAVPMIAGFATNPAVGDEVQGLSRSFLSGLLESEIRAYHKNKNDTRAKAHRRVRLILGHLLREFVPKEKITKLAKLLESEEPDEGAHLYLKNLQGYEHAAGYVLLHHFKNATGFLKKIAEDPAVMIHQRLYAFGWLQKHGGYLKTSFNLEKPAKDFLKEYVRDANPADGVSAPEVRRILKSPLGDEELKVFIMAVFLDLRSTGLLWLPHADLQQKMLGDIMSGRVRWGWDNANSHNEFGSRFLRSVSPSQAVMSAVHELAHQMLQQWGFYSESVQRKAAHEWFADGTAIIYALIRRLPHWAYIRFEPMKAEFYYQMSQSGHSLKSPIREGYRLARSFLWKINKESESAAGNIPKENRHTFYEALWMSLHQTARQWVLKNIGGNNPSFQELAANSDKNLLKETRKFQSKKKKSTDAKEEGRPEIRSEARSADSGQKRQVSLPRSEKRKEISMERDNIPDIARENALDWLKIKLNSLKKPNVDKSLPVLQPSDEPARQRASDLRLTLQALLDLQVMPGAEAAAEKALHGFKNSKIQLYNREFLLVVMNELRRIWKEEGHEKKEGYLGAYLLAANGYLVRAAMFVKRYQRLKLWLKDAPAREKLEYLFIAGVGMADHIRRLGSHVEKISMEDLNDPEIAEAVKNWPGVWLEKLVFGKQPQAFPCDHEVLIDVFCEYVNLLLQLENELENETVVWEGANLSMADLGAWGLVSMLDPMLFTPASALFAKEITVNPSEYMDYMSRRWNIERKNFPSLDPERVWSAASYGTVRRALLAHEKSIITDEIQRMAGNVLRANPEVNEANLVDLFQRAGNRVDVITAQSKGMIRHPWNYFQYSRRNNAIRPRAVDYIRLSPEILSGTAILALQDYPWVPIKRHLAAARSGSTPGYWDKLPRQLDWDWVLKTTAASLGSAGGNRAEMRAEMIGTENISRGEMHSPSQVLIAEWKKLTTGKRSFLEDQQKIYAKAENQNQKAIEDLMMYALTDSDWNVRIWVEQLNNRNSPMMRLPAGLLFEHLRQPQISFDQFEKPSNVDKDWTLERALHNKRLTLLILILDAMVRRDDGWRNHHNNGAMKLYGDEIEKALAREIRAEVEAFSKPGSFENWAAGRIEFLLKSYDSWNLPALPDDERDGKAIEAGIKKVSVLEDNAKLSLLDIYLRYMLWTEWESLMLRRWDSYDWFVDYLQKERAMNSQKKIKMERKEKGFSAAQPLVERLTALFHEWAESVNPGQGVYKTSRRDMVKAARAWMQSHRAELRKSDVDEAVETMIAEEYGDTPAAAGWMLSAWRKMSSQVEFDAGNPQNYLRNVSLKLDWINRSNSVLKDDFDRQDFLELLTGVNEVAKHASSWTGLVFILTVAWLKVGFPSALVFGLPLAFTFRYLRDVSLYSFEKLAAALFIRNNRSEIVRRAEVLLQTPPLTDQLEIEIDQYVRAAIKVKVAGLDDEDQLEWDLAWNDVRALRLPAKNFDDWKTRLKQLAALKKAQVAHSRHGLEFIQEAVFYSTISLLFLLWPQIREWIFEKSWKMFLPALAPLMVYFTESARLQTRKLQQESKALEKILRALDGGQGQKGSSPGNVSVRAETRFVKTSEPADVWMREVIEKMGNLTEEETGLLGVINGDTGSFKDKIWDIPAVPILTKKVIDWGRQIFHGSFFSPVRIETGRTIESGELLRRIFDDERAQQLQGTEALLFLQAVQLDHVYHQKKAPFSLFNLTLGKPVVFYVESPVDMQDAKKLTHVIVFNHSGETGVIATEFFFVDGIYAGYGTSRLSVSNLKEINMQFQLFPQASDGNEVRGKKWSVPIYGKRLDFWMDLLDEGESLEVRVQDNQYINSNAAMTMYARLGFKADDSVLQQSLAAMDDMPDLRLVLTKDRAEIRQTAEKILAVWKKYIEPTVWLAAGTSVVMFLFYIPFQNFMSQYFWVWLEGWTIVLGAALLHPLKNKIIKQTFALMGIIAVSFIIYHIALPSLLSWNVGTYAMDGGFFKLAQNLAMRMGVMSLAIPISQWFEFRRAHPEDRFTFFNKKNWKHTFALMGGQVSVVAYYIYGIFIPFMGATINPDTVQVVPFLGAAWTQALAKPVIDLVLLSTLMNGWMMPVIQFSFGMTQKNPAAGLRDARPGSSFNEHILHFVSVNPVIQGFVHSFAPGFVFWMIVQTTLWLFIPKGSQLYLLFFSASSVIWTFLYQLILNAVDRRPASQNTGGEDELKTRPEMRGQGNARLFFIPQDKSWLESRVLNQSASAEKWEMTATQTAAGLDALIAEAPDWLGQESSLIGALKNFPNGDLKTVVATRMQKDPAGLNDLVLGHHDMVVSSNLLTADEKKAVRQSAPGQLNTLADHGFDRFDIVFPKRGDTAPVSVILEPDYWIEKMTKPEDIRAALKSYGQAIAWVDAMLRSWKKRPNSRIRFSIHFGEKIFNTMPQIQRLGAPSADGPFVLDFEWSPDLAVSRLQVLTDVLEGRSEVRGSGKLRAVSSQNPPARSEMRLRLAGEGHSVEIDWEEMGWNLDEKDTMTLQKIKSEEGYPLLIQAVSSAVLNKDQVPVSLNRELNISVRDHITSAFELGLGLRAAQELNKEAKDVLLKSASSKLEASITWSFETAWFVMIHLLYWGAVLKGTEFSGKVSGEIQKIVMMQIVANKTSPEKRNISEEYEARLIDLAAAHPVFREVVASILKNWESSLSMQQLPQNVKASNLPKLKHKTTLPVAVEDVFRQIGELLIPGNDQDEQLWQDPADRLAKELNAQSPILYISERYAAVRVGNEALQQHLDFDIAWLEAMAQKGWGLRLRVNDDLNVFLLAQKGLPSDRLLNQVQVLEKLREYLRADNNLLLRQFIPFSEEALRDNRLLRLTENFWDGLKKLIRTHKMKIEIEADYYNRGEKEAASFASQWLEAVPPSKTIFMGFHPEEFGGVLRDIPGWKKKNNARVVLHRPAISIEESGIYPQTANDLNVLFGFVISHGGYLAANARNLKQGDFAIPMTQRIERLKQLIPHAADQADAGMIDFPELADFLVFSRVSKDDGNREWVDEPVEVSPRELVPQRSEMRRIDIQKAEQKFRQIIEAAALTYRPDKAEMTPKGIYKPTPAEDNYFVAYNLPVGKDQKKVKLVDAGSGRGWAILRMAHVLEHIYPDKEFEFVGIEFDDDKIKEANLVLAEARKSHFIKNSKINFKKGDFTHQNFSEEFQSADIVYYYSDGSTLVERLAGVLAKNLKQGSHIVEYPYDHLEQPLEESGKVRIDMAAIYNPDEWYKNTERAVPVFHLYTINRSEMRQEDKPWILVLDDKKIYFRPIEDIYGDVYNIMKVSTLEEAKRAVEAGTRFAFIYSDLDLLGSPFKLLRNRDLIKQVTAGRDFMIWLDEYFKNHKDKIPYGEGNRTDILDRPPSKAVVLHSTSFETFWRLIRRNFALRVIPQPWNPLSWFKWFISPLDRVLAKFFGRSQKQLRAGKGLPDWVHMQPKSATYGEYEPGTRSLRMRRLKKYLSQNPKALSDPKLMVREISAYRKLNGKIPAVTVLEKDIAYLEDGRIPEIKFTPREIPVHRLKKLVEKLSGERFDWQNAGTTFTVQPSGGLDMTYHGDPHNYARTLLNGELILIFPDETLKKLPGLEALDTPIEHVIREAQGSIGWIRVAEVKLNRERVLYIYEVQSSPGFHLLWKKAKDDEARSKLRWTQRAVGKVVEAARQAGYKTVIAKHYQTARLENPGNPETGKMQTAAATSASLVEHYKKPFKAWGAGQVRHSNGWKPKVWIWNLDSQKRRSEMRIFEKRDKVPEKITIHGSVWVPLRIQSLDVNHFQIFMRDSEKPLFILEWDDTAKIARILDYDEEGTDLNTGIIISTWLIGEIRERGFNLEHRGVKGLALAKAWIQNLEDAQMADIPGINKENFYDSQFVGKLDLKLADETPGWVELKRTSAGMYKISSSSNADLVNRKVWFSGSQMKDNADNLIGVPIFMREMKPFSGKPKNFASPVVAIDDSALEPFTLDEGQFKDFSQWAEDQRIMVKDKKYLIRGMWSFSRKQKSEAYDMAVKAALKNILDKLTLHYPGVLSHFAVMTEGTMARGELVARSDFEGRFIVLSDEDLQRYRPAFEFLREATERIFGNGWVQMSVESLSSEQALDTTVLSEMLDSKYLAGSQDIFAALQTAVEQHFDPLEFRNEPNRTAVVRKLKMSALSEMIDGLEEDRESQSYFEGLFNREPNTKNGVGGLRDMDYSRWVMQLVYGGIEQAKAAKQLSDSEWEEAQKAHEFIMQVRNALHEVQIREGRGVSSGSASHVMLFSDQIKVAEQMGIPVDPKNPFMLTRFLMEYHEATKTLFIFSNEVMRRAMHFLGSITEYKSLNKDLRYDGEKLAGIELIQRSGESVSLDSGKRSFKDQVALTVQFKKEIDAQQILKIFAFAAVNGYHITGELMDAIKKQRPQFQAWLKDGGQAASLDLLREIFSIPGIGYIRFRMHVMGILEDVWPDYELLENRIIHDYKHKHTLDYYGLSLIHSIDRFLAKTTVEKRLHPTPELAGSGQKSVFDNHLQAVSRYVIDENLYLVLSVALQLQAMMEFDPRMVDLLLNQLGLDAHDKSKVEWLIQHRDDLIEFIRDGGMTSPKLFNKFKQEKLENDYEKWSLLLLATSARIQFFNPGRRQVYAHILKPVIDLNEAEFKNTAQEIEKSFKKEKEAAAQLALRGMNMSNDGETKRTKVDVAIHPIEGAPDMYSVDVALDKRWAQPGTLARLSAALFAGGLSIQTLRGGQIFDDYLVDQFVVRVPKSFDPSSPQSVPKLVEKIRGHILSVLAETQGKTVQELVPLGVNRKDKKATFFEIPTLIGTENRDGSTFVSIQTLDYPGDLWDIFTVLEMHGCNILEKMSIDTEGFDDDAGKDVISAGKAAINRIEVQKKGKPLTESESALLVADLNYILQSNVSGYAVFETLPSHTSQVRLEKLKTLEDTLQIWREVANFQTDNVAGFSFYSRGLRGLFKTRFGGLKGFFSAFYQAAAPNLQEPEFSAQYDYYRRGLEEFISGMEFSEMSPEDEISKLSLGRLPLIVDPETKEVSRGTPALPLWHDFRRDLFLFMNATVERSLQSFQGAGVSVEPQGDSWAWQIVPVDPQVANGQEIHRFVALENNRNKQPDVAAILHALEIYLTKKRESSSTIRYDLGESVTLALKSAVEKADASQRVLVAEQFFKLLGNDVYLADLVWAFYESGFLEWLFPDLKAIKHQHDGNTSPHQYYTLRHLVQVFEHVQRLTYQGGHDLSEFNEGEAYFLRQFFQNYQKAYYEIRQQGPEALASFNLGVLLHDIGKAFPQSTAYAPSHQMLGSRKLSEILKHLKLDPKMARWLALNHQYWNASIQDVLMQRRTESQVLTELTRLAGMDAEHLKALFLISIADYLGVMQIPTAGKTIQNLTLSLRAYGDVNMLSAGGGSTEHGEFSEKPVDETHPLMRITDMYEQLRDYFSGDAESQAQLRSAWQAETNAANEVFLRQMREQQIHDDLLENFPPEYLRHLAYDSRHRGNQSALKEMDEFYRGFIAAAPKDSIEVKLEMSAYQRDDHRFMNIWLGIPEDSPGALALVSAVLSAHGLNIKYIFLNTINGRVLNHILVMKDDLLGAAPERSEEAGERMLENIRQDLNLAFNVPLSERLHWIDQYLADKGIASLGAKTADDASADEVGVEIIPIQGKKGTSSLKISVSAKEDQDFFMHRLARFVYEVLGANILNDTRIETTSDDVISNELLIQLPGVLNAPQIQTAREALHQILKPGITTENFRRILTETKALLPLRAEMRVPEVKKLAAVTDGELTQMIESSTIGLDDLLVRPAYGLKEKGFTAVTPPYVWRTIAERIPDRATRKTQMVDLGHGNGRFDIGLGILRPDINVTGIEYDAELNATAAYSLKNANLRGYVNPDQVAFEQGDWHDSKFDNVLRSADAVYHYDNGVGTKEPEALAKLLLEKLKPGALVMIFGQRLPTGETPLVQSLLGRNTAFESVRLPVMSFAGTDRGDAIWFFQKRSEMRRTEDIVREAGEIIRKVFDRMVQVGDLQTIRTMPFEELAAKVGAKRVTQTPDMFGAGIVYLTIAGWKLIVKRNLDITMQSVGITGPGVYYDLERMRRMNLAYGYHVNDAVSLFHEMLEQASDQSGYVDSTYHKYLADNHFGVLMGQMIFAMLLGSDQDFFSTKILENKLSELKLLPNSPEVSYLIQGLESILNQRGQQEVAYKWWNGARRRAGLPEELPPKKFSFKVNPVVRDAYRVIHDIDFDASVSVEEQAVAERNIREAFARLAQVKARGFTNPKHRAWITQIQFDMDRALEGATDAYTDVKVRVNPGAPFLEQGIKFSIELSRTRHKRKTLYIFVDSEKTLAQMNVNLLMHAFIYGFSQNKYSFQSMEHLLNRPFEIADPGNPNRIYDITRGETIEFTHLLWDSSFDFNLGEKSTRPAVQEVPQPLTKIETVPANGIFSFQYTEPFRIVLNGQEYDFEISDGVVKPISRSAGRLAIRPIYDGKFTLAVVGQVVTLRNISQTAAQIQLARSEMRDAAAQTIEYRQPAIRGSVELTDLLEQPVLTISEAVADKHSRMLMADIQTMGLDPVIAAIEKIRDEKVKQLQGKEQLMVKELVARVLTVLNRKRGSLPMRRQLGVALDFSADAKEMLEQVLAGFNPNDPILLVLPKVLAGLKAGASRTMSADLTRFDPKKRAMLDQPLLPALEQAGAQSASEDNRHLLGILGLGQNSAAFVNLSEQARWMVDILSRLMVAALIAERLESQADLSGDVFWNTIAADLTYFGVAPGMVRYENGKVQVELSLIIQMLQDYVNQQQVRTAA